MFFRNLLIYRLTQAIDWSRLEEVLGGKRARPCASQELATYGFVAPVGKGEQAPLVHAGLGCYLIAAREEERILPGTVVREALQEKVEEIEAQQLRKVYKKERNQLKDEIVQAFLPRAFVRRRQTFAAIDSQAGLIFVDASSWRVAEDLLSTLRECLGSLPVRPLAVKVAPSVTFTQWLKAQDAGNDLYLLDRAVLSDTHEGGGKIAATRQDLGSDEIQVHLSAGKLVTMLGLAWSDKLSFVLDEKLVVRQLRFEGLLHEQAAESAEDAAALADSYFALQTLTLREFVPTLIEALGGEEVPQGVSADSEPAATADEHIIDGDGPGWGVHDPLYAEAVAFVRESQRASISGVQRKFKLGYHRAAALIEAMEEAAVVTPMNTSGAREVIRF